MLQSTVAVDPGALRPGEHVCCVYRCESERWQAVICFVRASLEANMRVLLTLLPGDLERAVAALRDAGIDVDGAVGREQLGLGLSAMGRAAFDNFSATEVGAAARRRVEEALDRGYSGLRLVVEPAPLFGSGAQEADYLRFALGIEAAVASLDYCGLATFSREHTDPRILHEAVQTHPIIAVDGEYYRNTFYVPPGDLLADNWRTALVDRWIGGVADQGRKAAQQERLTVGLRAILDIADDLIACQDVDGVCRMAVESARERLGIERCSIFLSDGDMVRGTFGTDMEGRSTDERSFVGPPTEFWPDGLPAPPPMGPRTVHKSNARTEWNGGGFADATHGWYAMTPLWSPDGPLGAFYNDAIISRSEPDDVTQELVTVYASLLGPIIQRKRAEEKLEESERKYRTLFDGASDAIFIHGTDGRFIEANRAACDRLGYTREQLLGMSPADINTPEFAATADARLADVLEQGHAVFELVNRRKDGSTFPVEASSRVIEYGAGQAILTISRDITQRRNAEEDARLFWELVNQSFDTVLIADAGSGELLDCNQQAPVALGRRREKLLQLRLIDLEDELPADFSWVDSVAHLREQGGVVRDAAYRRGDNTTFPAEVSMSYIDSQARAYIVAVVRDTSDRRRLERQLRQAAKMEAVGQLAGGVAHDFNNILTGITGYTDFALAEIDPESDLHADLARVRALAGRASTLTRQLLAFSRRQGLEPIPLEVNGLIENLLKMLRRLIGEDVRLEFDAAPEPAVCRADPAQIEQVLVNLVVNARDAMPEGGALTLRTAGADVRPGDLEQTPPGGYVVITVRDTGVGMDEEVRRRVFEPFFTTKELGEGTGLGLAMAYGIVQDHGGEITVESRPGEGTAFHVYLPQAHATEEGAEEVVESAERGAETILVAEDEAEVRRLMCRILEDWGYEVLEAATPNEALEVFQERSGAIRLLLADVIMPESTGMALYERLLPEKPSLKVLYTSGYTPEDIARRGYLDPEAPFIRKPFAGADLARRVRELLDE